MAAVETDPLSSILQPITNVDDATSNTHSKTSLIDVSDPVLKENQELDSADIQLSTIDSNATSSPEVTKLPPDDSVNIPANAFSEAKKLMDTAEPLFVEDRITAEETEAGITHSKDATANSNVSESTATVTGNETEDTLMEEFGNDSKAENIHASSPKQAPTGLLSSDEHPTATEVTPSALESVPIAESKVLEVIENESAPGSVFNDDPVISTTNEAEAPVAEQSMTQITSGESNEDIQPEREVIVKPADVASAEQTAEIESVESGPPVEEVNNADSEGAKNEVDEEKPTEVDLTEDNVAEPGGDVVDDGAAEIKVQEAEEQNIEPEKPDISVQTEEAEIPGAQTEASNTSSLTANEIPIAVEVVAPTPALIDSREFEVPAAEDSTAPIEQLPSASAVVVEEEAASEGMIMHRPEPEANDSSATLEAPAAIAQKEAAEAVTDAEASTIEDEEPAAGSSVVEGSPIAEEGPAGPPAGSIEDVLSISKSHPEVEDATTQVSPSVVEEHAVCIKDDDLDVPNVEAEFPVEIIDAKATIPQPSEDEPAAEETPVTTEGKPVVEDTLSSQPIDEAKPSVNTAGLPAVEAEPVEQPAVEIEADPVLEVPVVDEVAASENAHESTVIPEQLTPAAENSVASTEAAAGPVVEDVVTHEAHVIDEVVDTQNTHTEPEKTTIADEIGEEKPAVVEQEHPTEPADLQGEEGRISEGTNELVKEQPATVVEVPAVPQDEGGTDAAEEAPPTIQETPLREETPVKRESVEEGITEGPMINDAESGTEELTKEDMPVQAVKAAIEAPVTAEDEHSAEEEVVEAAVNADGEVAEEEPVGEEVVSTEDIPRKSTAESAFVAGVVVEEPHQPAASSEAREAPIVETPVASEPDEKEETMVKVDAEQVGEPAINETSALETQRTLATRDGGVVLDESAEDPVPLEGTITGQDEEPAVEEITGEHAVLAPVVGLSAEYTAPDDSQMDQSAPDEITPPEAEVLVEETVTAQEHAVKDDQAAEPVAEESVIDTQATEPTSEQVAVDPTAIEAAEEPEIIIADESVTEAQEKDLPKEERVDVLEEGEIPVLEEKPIAAVGPNAEPSLDESVVSETSEADTTTETIMVPEPTIQKKVDTAVPVVELDVSDVDQVQTPAVDGVTKENITLNIPEGAAQIERPKSPWTPSFQVTTIGQGTSLPSEEDIPVHSLDNAEEVKDILPPQVAIVVHDNLTGAPEDVSQDPAEETDKPESASLSWTPSYSVHSQGSPSPTHVSLEPESSVVATEEGVQDKTAVAAIENIVVPEQIVPPVTENSESVKLEPTSIEKPSPAEESDVALEHTEPKNADIAEPSYEVPVTEATIPGSPVDGQEETSEPKVQEPVPEKSHLVLETESHPLEQQSAQDTSTLTPPSEQNRPASPSWVPSYSVSRQGSPLPQQASLPPASTDIPEIRLTSLPTDVQPAEDTRDEVPHDEIVSTPVTVAMNDTQPGETREEAQTVEDRPSSPWTPSYSVTVQGIDILEETQIESLTPRSDETKESEVQPRRSLSAEMESGAFSPTALIGAGVAGGAAVLAASAAIRKSKAGQSDGDSKTKADHTTNGDPTDSETHQDKAFPTVEIPDENKFNAASLPPLDENSALDTTTALSPDASPVSPRKRLESTTSSRLFPGGWFSNTSKIPDERTSLEVAQGVFTGAKQGTAAEEALHSPVVDPITPVREHSSSDKRRWCIIM